MKSKITFIFFIMIGLFVTVAIKAFYIQVYNRDKLLAYSKSQIVRVTKTYPRRGHILDRNGSPLAINIQKYNIFTFGKDLKQIRKELQTLSKSLENFDWKKRYKIIKKRKKFTWIRRKASLKKEQLKNLKKLKTIIIEPQVSRLYPNNELLSQTLGFVGIDNEGLSGVEYSFNDDLKGEALIHKYLKDAKGRPFKYKSTVIDHEAKDITLSIDKDVQANLEESLRAAVIEHKAQMGGAAVMDATTGEVWAMANYPSFDPNKIRGPDRHNLKLSFITDPVEPGSIFKTLTVASAIENKIVSNDTNYFCEKGSMRVGKHLISESDNRHKYEWLSVEEILKYSSNVGTTKIAFDLTYPLLYKSLKKLGIGEKTNIELPGESRGILDENKNISPIRLSNISFGQGVATTGIQMMKAYSIIANGGYDVKPTILKVDRKKVVKKRKRVLLKDTTKNLTKMLSKAVSEGTGTKAQIAHFEIAGKTSTAQRPDESGGYSGYISGFIGYPVNIDDRFVVFVYIDNPKGHYYGNLVAAPVFNKIVKNILYKKKKYSKLANKELDKDYVKLKSAAKRVIRKGELPNFIGLDKRTAKKILERLKVNYTFEGFGVVKSQSVVKGTKVSKNLKVTLKFEPPKYEN